MNRNLSNLAIIGQYRSQKKMNHPSKNNDAPIKPEPLKIAKPVPKHRFSSENYQNKSQCSVESTKPSTKQLSLKTT